MAHAAKREFCTLDVTRINSYLHRVIRGFKCKRTERLFRYGECDKRFRPFMRQAEKRLRILDAAETLDSLRMLPSNRFEALGGDRKGQFSIAVNMQWRLCFTWQEDGPHDVEMVDYH